MTDYIQKYAGRFLRQILKSGVIASCMFGSAAHAAITFQFHYIDPVGTGFLDPIYGSSRQAALNTAASTFSSMFASHFNTTGTIILDVAADNTTGVLAAAQSYRQDPGVPGFNYGEVVRTKLQTGVDLNGNDSDGRVSVNFDQPWALDINSPPTWDSGQYDIYGTLYHEFTHTLGFFGAITKTGEPLAGIASVPIWNTFDSFLVDRHDVKLIDPTTFALNQADWDISSVGDFYPGSDREGLFFNGPNADAANGGRLVTLYAPSEWEGGSSVSHLSPYYGTLMTPASDTGLQAHDYSPIEVGILTDIGYVAAIPEPETYAMLLAGLLVCGWIARRRESNI